MNATPKSKKRTIRDTKKSFIVKELAIKYHITPAMVYKAVRGDSDSELADVIKKDFNRIETELPRLIQGKSKLFIQK